MVGDDTNARKINQAIEVLGRGEKLDVDKVLREFQEKLRKLQLKARGAVFVLLSDLNARIEEARLKLPMLNERVDAQISLGFSERITIWQNRWNDWLASAKRKAEGCNLGGAIEDLMVAERVFHLDRPGASSKEEFESLGKALDLWLKESKEGVATVVTTFLERCK